MATFISQSEWSWLVVVLQPSPILPRLKGSRPMHINVEAGFFKNTTTKCLKRKPVKLTHDTTKWQC